jgi:hypothetical protein
MLLFELAALSIVSVYILSRIFGYPERKKTITRFVVVAAASWVAEETCIFLYDFYNYRPIWSLYIGDVPILVVVIWPAVVQSAWDMASQLVGRSGRCIPLVAAGIVFADASFIEPVAVNAGLWFWKEPGVFSVPIIGLFGWSSFAFFCTLVFQVKESKMNPWGLVFVSVLPVVGTHVILVCSWWMIFRWIRTPFNPSLVVGTAWAVSMSLLYGIRKYRIGFRVKRKTLLLRLPAAVLLLILLALSEGTSKYLVAYATAFIAPYLALMAQQYDECGEVCV